MCNMLIDLLHLYFEVFPCSTQESPKGRYPWFSGYGRCIMFEMSWVWIPVPYTGWNWHFLSWFVAKIVMMFVWKDWKLTKKRRVWPDANKAFSLFAGMTSGFFQSDLMWDDLGRLLDNLKMENCNYPFWNETPATSEYRWLLGNRHLLVIFKTLKCCIIVKSWKAIRVTDKPRFHSVCHVKALIEGSFRPDAVRCRICSRPKFQPRKEILYLCGNATVGMLHTTVSSTNSRNRPSFRHLTD